MHRIRANAPAAALAVLVLVALAACSASASSGSSTGPTDGAGTGPLSTAPQLTIAPSLPTQTDTSWGRIWDAVPDSFPSPTGAEPATDPGQGPASGHLVVTAAANDVADGYVVGLHGAGWTVNKDGPLEDGSIVVNATKAGGCKAQVSVKSIGDASLAAILYGASCPFA